MNWKEAMVDSNKYYDQKWKDIFQYIQSLNPDLFKTGGRISGEYDYLDNMGYIEVNPPNINGLVDGIKVMNKYKSQLQEKDVYTISYVKDGHITSIGGSIHTGPAILIFMNHF